MQGTADRASKTPIFNTLKSAPILEQSLPQFRANAKHAISKLADNSSMQKNFLRHRY